MSKVREQIVWLGTHVWLADPRAFEDLKKTMEKLLAVYEAAGEYLSAETLDNQLRLNAAWNAVPDNQEHKDG